MIGEEAAALLPDTAETGPGGLAALGGVGVAELAERFGTPLYVLDRATVVGRMRAYRSAFAEATVAYAAKALCVTGVLQLARAEGLAVDCASAGELATARAAGLAPADVVLHGNNKSDDELAAAVDLGIGRVVVDGFSELARLDRLAAAAGRRVGIQLRVTPGVEAHTHEFVRTGHDDSKFGFTLSKGLAHEAVDRALAGEALDLRGLHCHIGSQVLGLGGFVAAAETMAGLLVDVRDAHGVELAELNLGGGMGIAALGADRPPEPDRFAAAVQGAVAAVLAEADMAMPHLMVEPGRSVVGRAGMTLYRVGPVKEIPGVRTYLAVDGGMSDNPRFALYGAEHLFVPAADRRLDGPHRDVAVVGKHCETGDVLGERVRLPADLGEGDLLAVAGTGGYNHAMASNYNRLPRPAMVLVDEGEAVELVRRETIDDVLARDVPLPGA